MRPRICLATDSREPSGVGEHMLTLAAELATLYDVVLACPESHGGRSLLDRASRLGIAIKQLDDDPGATAAWLGERGFELLHVHAGIGWEGHELAWLGRQAHIRAIVRTEHLPDVITDPDQRRAHTEGVALVDRIICVSQASATSHGEAGADRDKLVVVRNGLNGCAPRRPRNEVRSELGLTSAQPMVLTTARLTPQKDPATLVDAARHVLARISDARFILAGDGPLAQEMRDKAAREGMAESIVFLGNRSDVPDLLGAADLFVLPSRFEGLPLAVIEAMSAGLPVVATRVGGTDEVVRDGVTGLLVPPGDPARLADAIASVLGDPTAKRAMGEAGRLRFADAFTAAEMARNTAEIYRGLGVGPLPPSGRIE